MRARMLHGTPHRDRGFPRVVPAIIIVIIIIVVFGSFLSAAIRERGRGNVDTIRPPTLTVRPPPPPTV